MVPIRDLDDDSYVFDETSYCLMGKRAGKVYRLGAPIRIQVARTNIERKIIDFALPNPDGTLKTIRPLPPRNSSSDRRDRNGSSAKRSGSSRDDHKKGGARKRNDKGPGKRAGGSKKRKR